MRRPVVSIALLIALALACASPGPSRGRIGAEAAALAGASEQTALVPVTQRDPRFARQADGRTPTGPHGLATPFVLPHPRDLATPASVAIGRAMSLAGPPPLVSPGSPRTSRGPPRSTTS